MNKFDDMYIEEKQNHFRKICSTCWKYPICEKRKHALLNHYDILECNEYL
jgi:hypothetical protein